MALSSLPPLKNSLRETLDYFARFDYPLTPDELWFWQHDTSFSKEKIEKLFNSLGQLEIRNSREKFSQPKWKIAYRVGERLSRIPIIEAIFVTGALAMNNCPEDDDIDIMIITTPHTLWLTRLIIYLNIRPFRRKPKTTHAPNLVCDNLYLDTNNLTVHEHSIYTAHEILQTKCIFDRGGIHRLFLESNSWAKSYLPIAYSESLKKFENLKIKKLFGIWDLGFGYLFVPVNLIAFVLQYLYMRSKMTSERVSWGYAFFHPGSDKTRRP